MKLFGQLCNDDGWIISYIKVLELDVTEFYCIEISCPRGAIGRALNLASKGPRFESWRVFLKVWAISFWRAVVDFLKNFVFTFPKVIWPKKKVLKGLINFYKLYICQIHLKNMGGWLIKAQGSKMDLNKKSIPNV